MKNLFMSATAAFAMLVAANASAQCGPGGCGVGSQQGYYDQDYSQNYGYYDYGQGVQSNNGYNRPQQGWGSYPKRTASAAGSTHGTLPYANQAIGDGHYYGDGHDHGHYYGDGHDHSYDAYGYDHPKEDHPVLDNSGKPVTYGSPEAEKYHQPAAVPSAAASAASNVADASTSGHQTGSSPAHSQPNPASPGTVKADPAAKSSHSGW